MVHGLFYLYLILLPLMNLPGVFPLSAKVQYSDLVFIFFFISWCFVLAKSKKIPLPPKRIVFSLALLILVNVFSFACSKKLFISLLDFLGLIYLITVFWAFSFISQEKALFKKAINIIFITSVSVSLTGILSSAFHRIYNYAWTQHFLFISNGLKTAIVPFARIKSTLVLPEMFIVFSQLGLVCGMISLEFQKNALKKRLWALGIITIIFAAVFAYSRSLVGLFFTLFSVMLLKKGFRLRPALLIIGILFIMLFVSAVITSIWVMYPVTLWKDNASELMHVTFNLAPDIRAPLRHAALAIALRNPLFGVGQGMFTFESKKYFNFNTLRNTPYRDSYASLEIDPHCAYLGTMAETGFVGLGVILLFFYFIIKNCLESLKGSSSAALRNAEAYLLASVIGYLLTGWFMDIFSLRPLWITLAFLSGVNIMREKDGLCI